MVKTYKCPICRNKFTENGIFKHLKKYEPNKMFTLWRGTVKEFVITGAMPNYYINMETGEVTSE